MRTRFAPSPTGELHFGGLRTALYSYCLARKQPKGQFFLRIEDTDLPRTVPGAKERLIAVMDRCGLHRDAPYVQQSKRLPKYTAFANQLVEEGKAYRCFCTKERLDILRQSQNSQRQATKYDGKCSHVSAQESQARVDAGEAFTIRMKSPMVGHTLVQDEIMGQIKFANADAMDDQIILKQDGFPTYHLASVVDDHEMEITHVIRGDEWLSSTPKHLVLYQMFGWHAPKFAHLPLLLTKDKKKLSKRNPLGASVESFLDQGYQPSAMLNFVYLLGSPVTTTGAGAGGDEDQSKLIYGMDKLVEKFSLENLSRGAGAVVDGELLGWMNSMHIREIVRAGPGSPEFDLLYHQTKAGFPPDADRHTIVQVMNLLKERVRFPSDFSRLGAHVFRDEIELGALPKGTEPSVALRVVDEALQRFSAQGLDGVSVEVLHKELGVEKRDVLNTLRWALTGLPNGAPMGDTCRVLGLDKTVARLQRARLHI